MQEVHPGARFPRVLAFEQDEDLDDALHVVAPSASVVVATEFCSDGGDHAANASVPAELVAAAAVDRGIPTAVERNPVLAVHHAVEDGDEAVPVVVSGSFHLLAALGQGTTTR